MILEKRGNDAAVMLQWRTMKRKPGPESRLSHPDYVQMFSEAWRTNSTKDLARLFGISERTARLHAQKLGLRESAPEEGKEESDDDEG